MGTKRRDLGGLIFVDLRDREGVVQIVFNPDFSQEALSVAEKIRSEYVIQVKGLVTKRDEKSINDKIKTGKVEVQVSEITILNESETPPFSITDMNDIDENVRLKISLYRLKKRKFSSNI